VLSTTATAWRIVSAERIPPGAVAMTTAQGGVMCGFQTEEDSLIRIIDPHNGRIISEFTAPEARCNGISYNGSIWFTGAEHLYNLERDGRIRNQLEKPYGVMRGLAVQEANIFWSIVLDNDIYYLTLFEAGGEELRRFSTTVQNPVDIAYDGTFLWVTDYVDGFLHLFNPVTEREVDLFPTPMGGPSGITTVQREEDTYIALIDNGQDDDTDILYIIDTEGEEAPKILPISRRFDFGIVEIIFDSDFNFSIYNIGGLDLTLDSIRLASGEECFTLGRLPRPPIIPPGRYAFIPINFDPEEYRHYVDTLIVFTNDPEEPVVRIVLLGLGIFQTRRLGTYPEILDFGVVRADPWRDGSRYKQLALFNMGFNTLRIDDMENHIEEIFHFESPLFPLTLETAETLLVDFWFTPHRGIQYIDTLMTYSNGIHRIVFSQILGTASDTVYNSGEVMWYHRLEEGEGAIGTIIRQRDINNDEIDDVIAVGPAGTVYCLNGFASDEADVLWVQNFANEAFSPTDVQPSGVMTSSGDLNGDGVEDVVIGSGTEDRAVYGLSGTDGDLLWRWDARNVGAEGRIVRIAADHDLNGDGANDPVILIRPDDEGQHRLVRLDGATGRPAWARNPGTAISVEPLTDFDHDGVMDFVVMSADNRLEIYSGIDGSLMQSIRANCQAPIFPAQDLDGDNWLDIIFYTVDGALSAYSVHAQRELWNVDHFDRFQLNSPIKYLLDLESDFNEDGINEMVGCDLDEITFCFNPVNGESWWVEQVTGASMAVIPDHLNGDCVPEIVIGLEEVRILCLDGRHGDELWSFQYQNVGDIVHIIAFEDVDFGRSDDIVAIFSDGVVRCISSGGDLGVKYPPIESTSPTTPMLTGIYPNPFNCSVKIGFTLNSFSHITLSVWDTNGRQITVLDLGLLNPGMHKIPFNPLENKSMPNGIYMFRLDGASGHAIGQGILLK